MSQHGEREPNYGNYDPGGAMFGQSPPTPIELDPERLEHANSLHRCQSVGCDGRIESFDLYTGGHVQPRYDNPEKPAADTKSFDSGLASMTPSSHEEGTIPIADYTLDSIPDNTPYAGPSTSAKLPLARLLAEDPGYASLRSADFSSIGSSLSGDSGFTSTTSLISGSDVHKPTSTSSQLPESVPESWHNQSSRQILRDFAEKMNYTEAEFEQCMRELGEDGMDRDKLLRHLVKIRDSKPNSSQKSSSRSASKRVTSSSQTRCEGDSKGLRRIVIDGSNVAMEHGLHQVYSCRGIEIAVKYFQDRGHELITVFVPAHRLRSDKHLTKDQHLLRELSRRGVVVKTPSRRSSKGNIASYEDRFILKLASTGEAIVVSNDQFRDLKSESSAFRETIEKRILPFAFVNDQFIPADDPLGRRGPTLEQFLRVDAHNTSSGMCPYGRKCTYGTKCRYGHPEREDAFDSALGDCGRSGQYSSNTSSPVETSTSSSNPALRQEYWANRQMQIASQTMGPYVHPANFPYMVNNPANHQQSSNPHTNYCIPVDYSGAAPPRFAAEYPPVGVSHPPLASRACIHTANDQSYTSVPLDDPEYLSRQPIFDSNSLSTPSTEITSQTVTSRPHELISLAQDFSSQATISIDTQSTLPMPLNENIGGGSSRQSTFVAEGRVPPQPGRRNPYDKEIPETDPRFKVYYHLKNLFNETIVRRVMNKYPYETDPNKITAEVLRHQSRTVKANVAC